MNKQRESVYTLRREILEGKVHLTEDEVVDTPRLRAGAGRGHPRRPGRSVRRQDSSTPSEWDLPALMREVVARLRLEPTRLEALELDEKSADEIARRDLGRWSRRTTRRRNRSSARDMLRRRRARHHAADRRSAVEGPPLLARPPQGRHRPARLRPARSARRVQEGELRAVPGHEGADRGRDRPLSLLAAAGRSRGARRSAPAPARRRAAHGQPSAQQDAELDVGPAPVRRRRRRAGPASAQRRRRRRRGSAATTSIKTVRRDEPKVGRNDPCPCGSGKKYKKCHGQQRETEADIRRPLAAEDSWN